MVKKFYLIIALVALAQFTPILASVKGFGDQIQSNLCFIDIEEHNRILNHQYERYLRSQLIDRIRSLIKKHSTTTEAPMTVKEPYLHEALYSYRRFG